MAKGEADIVRGLNLGQSRDILENRGGSKLSELMLDMAGQIVERLKQKLDEKNINTTSQALSQSIGVRDLTIDGNSITVSIEADYYWKYVNYGVNGSEVDHGAPDWGPEPGNGKSFKQNILEWIPKRGLALPQQFTNFDQFAFAIMTNIRKFGTEPRPFFDEVVNSALETELAEPFEALMGEAINIRILSPWQ